MGLHKVGKIFSRIQFSLCFNLNLHLVMINTIMTEIPTIFFILSFLKIKINFIIIDNIDPT